MSEQFERYNASLGRVRECLGRLASLLAKGLSEFNALLTNLGEEHQYQGTAAERDEAIEYLEDEL